VGGHLGPYHVASAGTRFRDYTFQQDQEVDYQAANTLLNIYLGPTLRDPKRALKIIKHDYLRVVYHDGQIYDYLITAYPSSVPLNNAKKMPTVNTTHLSPEWERAQRDCNMGRSQHKSVTINTGFWGVSETRYPDHDQISSSWVSTGTREYDFDDCGGK
jgi:hypothetical protein